VRQFEHGACAFRAVADESQREAAFRVILATQQLHAEGFGVEGNRFIEIADANHGVQNAHAVFLGF